MKILANDGISGTGKSKLIEAGFTVLENRIFPEHLVAFIQENQIDILLVRSATQVRKELIEACPSLKIIGRGGIGLDNIDVDYALEKGIKVINTPNASSRSVAELVFAHFYTLVRNLHESNRLMPLEGESRFEQLKNELSNSYELEGKTLGVIGFGSIGKEVVKLGIANGMNVKVLTRKPKTEKIEFSFFDGQKVIFEVKSTNNWDEFLKDTQFISINTPKTNDYIIDTTQLEKMENGVFIVNTARGGVINEMSLVHFLDSGKLAGAALDVFENEPHPELQILMNRKLSLSPHLGGNTLDAQEKIGADLADQIIQLVKKN